MTILPQGRVEIMKNIGWDSSYKHVRRFTSDTQQVAYMVAHTYKVIDKCTFIRERSALAVPGDVTLYQDANYLAFANLGFSGKIFYAFITAVEYVNPDCTYLYFQIDHYQTWLFQLQIDKCFVNREHVSDDTIGKHTVPEGLPFGDLVTRNFFEVRMSPTPILLYAGSSFSGTVDSTGLYNPLSNRLSASVVAEKLDELADQPEKIASLKMGFEPVDKGLPFSRSANGFYFAGETYTPVNNKLYCYPYCSLSIDDYGANVAEFKWEDFSDPMEVSFQIKNLAIPFPISMITPQNYRGLADANNYMLVKTDFPDCPFTIDNYRAWMSSVGLHQNINLNAQIDQTIVADVSGLVGTITGGISSASSGNPLGVVSSVTSGVSGYVSRGIALDQTRANNAVDKAYAQTHGTSIGGQFGGTIAPWTQGLRGWRAMYNTIKPEYARMIDGFFTRFGYKVDTYKVPNVASRTRFNYVKTVDAHVGGNIPDEAATLLESMLNAGVTIWHTDAIGEYSARNTIDDNFKEEEA